MKREEIVKLLEELHQKLSASHAPSQLEIDIIKDDIKVLYSKVLAWENKSATIAPVQEPATEMHVVQQEEPESIPAPVVEPEPPVAEEPTKVEAPDITPSYEETVQPPVVEPEPPAYTPAPEPQATEVEMEKEDIPEPTPELTPEPVVAQPEKKDHIVAERLEAGQKDNSIAGKWNQNPISDLKTAIGLNDKFSFIHGLFKGKVDAYNDAIGKLNSLSDVSGARQYLEFLGSEYSWDAKSEEYLKLKNFVERRYS